MATSYTITAQTSLGDVAFCGIERFDHETGARSSYHAVYAPETGEVAEISRYMGEGNYRRLNPRQAKHVWRNIELLILRNRAQ